MPDERGTTAAASADDDAHRRAIEEILRAVKNVKFGSVEIAIHDSKVVQIERKERVRLVPLPKSTAD